MPLPIEDRSFLFVCRHCERLAEGRDARRETCGQDCAGPKKGRDFPRYRGPLTPEFLIHHCFACGEATPMSLNLTGTTRILGVCKRHLIHAGVKYEDLKTQAKPEDFGAVEKKIVKATPEELLGLGKEPEK